VRAKSEEGKGIIQIVFKEEVAVDNLPELSIQSSMWEMIIRAYSILADVAPEETKIIASNKVNPYFLWLATTPLISKAICATVKPFIELWREVLSLQEHALALKEKKINLAEKHIDLIARIAEHEDKRIKEILEGVATTFIKEGTTPNLTVKAVVLLTLSACPQNEITIRRRTDNPAGAPR
jgi:hypothetical protein